MIPFIQQITVQFLNCAVFKLGNIYLVLPPPKKLCLAASNWSQVHFSAAF